MSAETATLPRATPAAKKNTAAFIRPERITDLARELSRRLGESLSRINSINGQSRTLSLNTQIEASRSGEAGKAFGVVAREMRNLSQLTTEVAAELSEHVRSTAGELEELSQALANQVRGMRLSDLALNNIDLIDRNLYERSCDCRWWATDSSLVEALTSRTPEAIRYASSRMGVILDSYTVYFDLVLTDRNGIVVANGRPGRYASSGSCHARSAWFQSAMTSRSGQDFGFESVHESALVGGQRVLVYSCGVRAGGDVRGELLGALGVVFNWDGLAGAVIKNTPLYDDERACTRICICDDDGLVLAENGEPTAGTTLDLPGQTELFAQKKNFVLQEHGKQRRVIAHARAPGFETYSTGWHSLIIQELD